MKAKWKKIFPRSNFVLNTTCFENETFKIFPNPASGFITIVSSVPIEKIELFDIQGEKVLSSIATQKLNVENLKSGMYLLKIFNNDKSATKRLIIK